jgi:hypothetical protein
VTNDKSKLLILATMMLTTTFISCKMVQPQAQTNPVGNSNNSTNKPAATLTENQKTIPAEVLKLIPLELGRFTQVDGWKPNQVDPSPSKKEEQIEEYWAFYRYTDGRFDKYREKMDESNKFSMSDITYELRGFTRNDDKKLFFKTEKLVIKSKA